MGNPQTPILIEAPTFDLALSFQLQGPIHEVVMSTASPSPRQAATSSTDTVAQ